MTVGDLTGPRREELARLVRALRASTLASVTLDASTDALRALADRAEALAGALAPFAAKRPFPAYSADPTDLPFSPVSGPFNPMAPEVAFVTEGDAPKHVIARVRFSDAYEGPPSYLHGGLVASMFDQVLAFANRANGVGAMTVSLAVRYRRPTPLNTELRFEAWTVRVEGQRVFARGECHAGDELLTECDGVFVRVDAERARRLFGGRV